MRGLISADFSCWTDGLICASRIQNSSWFISDCRVPRSSGCKTTTKHDTFFAVLYSEYELFLLKCCIWFETKILLGIKVKLIPFASISFHQTLFQKFCGLVRYVVFCEPQSCFHIVLDRRSHLLAALYFFRLHLIVLSWNSTFNILLGSQRQVLGFCISLQSNLGVNLLGHQLLGRLVSVLNAFHCRILSSKLFGNGFITLSRLMCCCTSNSFFYKTAASLFPSWHCFRQTRMPQSSKL